MQLFQWFLLLLLLRAVNWLLAVKLYAGIDDDDDDADKTTIYHDGE